MSRVRGKNTRPEIIVRSFLHSKGLRFRIHRHDLPGTPDIVLPKYKMVIFVNGCFWHQHEGCKKSSLPKTREKWWKDKLQKNVNRDKKTVYELEKMGWRVFIVWECELTPKKHQETLLKLVSDIYVQQELSI